MATTRCAVPPPIRTKLNATGTGLEFSLGGDATVPLSLTQAVQHAWDVMALVVSARTAAARRWGDAA